MSSELAGALLELSLDALPSSPMEDDDSVVLDDPPPLDDESPLDVVSPLEDPPLDELPPLEVVSLLDEVSPSLELVDEPSLDAPALDDASLDDASLDDDALDDDALDESAVSDVAALDELLLPAVSAAELSPEVPSLEPAMVPVLDTSSAQPHRTAANAAVRRLVPRTPTSRR